MPLRCEPGFRWPHAGALGRGSAPCPCRRTPQSLKLEPRRVLLPQALADAPGTAAAEQRPTNGEAQSAAWAYQGAPRPHNEAERLGLLRALGVLDSESEGPDPFDAITRLLCAVFNVPIALVSLVDAGAAGDAAPVAAAAVAALSLAAACLHRGPMPLPPLAAAPRYAPQSGSGSSRCRGWGRACRRAAASRSVPGPCCPTALMCWCVPWAAGGWGQRASGSELVEKAAVAAWQRRGGAGEAADARRAAWLVPPSLVPPPSPPPHPPLPCNHPPPNQPACR